MLAGALAWGFLPAVLVEQALVVHVGERPQAQAEHYVAERREVKQDGELGLPDAELAATERLGQGVRDSEEVEVLGTQDGAWCDGDASACVVIEGCFLDFQARYLVVPLVERELAQVGARLVQDARGCDERGARAQPDAGNHDVSVAGALHDDAGLVEVCRRASGLP